MAKDDRIKCRLCDWSVPKGPTVESRDRAFKALASHIGNEHDELADVLEHIRSDDDEIRSTWRQLLET